VVGHPQPYVFVVDRSFHNMVWFYGVELRRVLNGESAKAVLGKGRRRHLARYGVLRFNGGTSKGYSVSPEALALLSGGGAGAGSEAV